MPRIARRYGPLAMVGFAAIAALAGAPRPSGAAVAQVDDSPWETQWGGFNDLYDIDALSPNDIWAVGSNVVHFDGHAWRAVDRREVHAGLSGIDMIEPGEGWAVGSRGFGQGVAIPIRGGQLGEPQELPGVGLGDVVLFARDDGWAVGMAGGSGPAAGVRRGVVYRLQQGVWREHTRFAQSVSPLVGLWLASRDDGWAVSDQGQIVRFDGQTWSLAYEAREPLRAIGGTAPDDVWAVGGTDEFADGEQRRVMFRLDDMLGWKKVRDEPGAGWSALGFRGNTGFAVSWYGDVSAYQRGAWEDGGSYRMKHTWFGAITSLSLPPNAPEMLIANEGGEVYSFAERELTQVHTVPELHAIDMVGPTLGWAVGWGGALVFDGERWNPADKGSPLRRANDIAVVSATDAWAVGTAGMIAQWEGARWLEVNSPTDVHLQRVRVVSPECVWALGTKEGNQRQGTPPRGVVLRFDGRAWQVVLQLDIIRESDFTDIDALSSDQAWVVGANGVLRAFDRGVWTERPIPRGVRSLDVIAPDDMWLGGDAIYRYDGSGAEATFSFPNMTVYSVRMLADGTGWAAGWSGQVIRYDDRRWRLVRGPPDPVSQQAVPYALYDVDALDVAGVTHVWAAGAQHTVLHTTFGALGGRPAVTPNATPTVNRPPPTDTPTPTETAPPTASPTPRPVWKVYLPRARR